MEQLDVLYPTWFTDVTGHFTTQWGASSGVVVSGSRHILRDSRIRFSAGNGVSVLGSKNVIQGNAISGVDIMAVDCAGIHTGVVANSADHEISNNTISATGRSGINPRNMYSTDPTTWNGSGSGYGRLHHNDVSGFGMQDWDCGGIYTYGSNGWIRIDHNTIHDATADVDQRPGNGAYSVGGVYIDYGRRVLIDHNAVWNVEWGIHLQNKDPGGAADYLVYNNTVMVKRFNPSVTYGPFGAVENSGVDFAGTEIRNNLFVCSESLTGYKVKDAFLNAVTGTNLGSNGTAGYLPNLGLNLTGGSVYPAALYPTASSSLIIGMGTPMPPTTRSGITIPALNDTTASTVDIGAYRVAAPAWTSGASAAVVSGSFWSSPSIAGVYLFYNRSAWDGDDAAASAADDGAIATDKTPLLPGQTAAFANYTSYSRGLNGLMIDVVNLTGVPTAGDFVFTVGNDSNPAGWSAAPAPTSITVRSGSGTGGSSRVTLIWADNAIAKQWLRVQIPAGGAIGLSSLYTCYVGNAIGEVGNSAADAIVSGSDQLQIRLHSTAPLGATITNLYDVNRDKAVSGSDQLLCRLNSTSPGSALILISP
jgi:hypothetical protein